MRIRAGSPAVLGRRTCHHERGMTKKGAAADQREDCCLELDLTLREERWKENDFDRDVS